MASAQEDRAYWAATLDRIARPVLAALAARRLKATMPVETSPGNKSDRQTYTHLEALGRTIAGISPWVELGLDDSTEGRQRGELANLARQSIDSGTDPQSPDYMNFSHGGQPVVDAAFLA